MISTSAHEIELGNKSYEIVKIEIYYQTHIYIIITLKILQPILISIDGQRKPKVHAS